MKWVSDVDEVGHAASLGGGGGGREGMAMPTREGLRWSELASRHYQELSASSAALAAAPMGKTRG